MAITTVYQQNNENDDGKSLSGAPVLVLLLVTQFAAASGVMLFENTFEKTEEAALWSQWPPGANGTITLIQPGFDSASAALFSTAKGGWNTPIIVFPKPIPVSEKTVIEFEIDAQSGGELNIQNAVDGGEYSISFRLPRGRVTIRRYLRDALYKRLGNPQMPKDGLVGDAVSKIQIAVSGKRVVLDNFRMYDASVPVVETLLRPQIGLAPSLRKYDRLESIFPYGPIITVAAERGNASYFGQPFEDRFENQMLDIRRHYGNTIANFCDDGNIEYRLELMKKYQLNLVETHFSWFDFASAAPKDAPVQTVLRFKDNERLLVWYGRDEPQDVEAYLKNKLAIQRLDQRHPYASAICDPQGIRMLGKHLELMIIDPYYITADAPPSATPGLNIMSYIAQTRKSMSSGKIWLISQTFSLRYRNEPQLRYPTREEVRFGIYSAIAAGIKGILFFIYNDSVAFLDGTVRNEEFDTTLVDAWGNDNATYRELAKVGRKILPIMPSFMDADVVPASQNVLRVDRDDVVVGELEGRAGRLAVVVSKEHKKTVKCSLNIDLQASEKLYDLFTLEEITPGFLLELAPMDGRMFVITTPDIFSVVRGEIIERVDTQEAQRLRIEVMELQRAGFDVNEPQTALSPPELTQERLTAIREQLEKIKNLRPDYVKAEKQLLEIRRLLGVINEGIASKITSLDGTQDTHWQSVFEKIKVHSREYFAIRSALRNGKITDPNQIAALVIAVQQLLETVEHMLANQ